MAELLAGTEIVLPDGSRVDAGTHLAGKMVALYFSAGWCPPCRAFTPKLKHFYEDLHEDGKNFEVVFVSRDKEENDLIEYYTKNMSALWTYIPFGNPKIQELLEKYEVKTIPALRVIKDDGTVVVVDGRSDVADKGQRDPAGLYEDWEAFYAF